MVAADVDVLAATLLLMASVIGVLTVPFATWMVSETPPAAVFFSTLTPVTVNFP